MIAIAIIKIVFVQWLLLNKPTDSLVIYTFRKYIHKHKMKHILNKLSIFLLLLLMAATAQAQQNRKFHVQSFEQNQFDTSARVKATEKYDGNGDRYSIIKVTSTNPNDDLMAYSFDFGMMNSLVEQHDDELWVYVQRNAKHVTIKREGYATVRNYDLRTTIQPGQVFDMVLSPEAEKISRQMLLFKVSPSSSQAIITYKREGENDYKVFGNGNVDESGMAAMSLELGTYIYKIISQKYHPTEGRVVLNTRNGKHVEQVTLRPNFANVTLNTIDGAEIYIDDAKKGAGSWTGTLTPGTYSLECRKESYKSSYQTITVEEGKDLTLQLDAPTPITGVLSMMSSPLDATIAVDGKDCGTTPLIIDDILVGKRKITVSKQGYTTATIDVIINEGETTEESITLEKVEVRSVTIANGVANGAITISKPRNQNELLSIACANKNDGSIIFFTGEQWEALAADERSLYAELGVSIKENGHEFIIAIKDCNYGEKIIFGAYMAKIAGIANHDENVIKSQFINTGYSDTKVMVRVQRGKKDERGIVGVPAAEAAWNYKANGYDKQQWYLPSISELQMIYRNKKAINSFMARYIDGATEIVDDYYWSSTGRDKDSSWTVHMNSGHCYHYGSRSNSYRVRAVTVVK